MHETLLTYASSRYLWISLGLVAVAIAAYAIHQPVGVANGGTWLGYTLGSIGALLIFWLMWFGIRKRKYASTNGTVLGWLSAHVYLGTALVVISLLHSGFQFGWNLHTLTFSLMVAVVLSGMFGVYAYMRYPGLMTRNRDSATRDAMLAEIAELDQNSLQLADGIAPKIHGIVMRSIQNTRLGGGVLALLRPRDDSDRALVQAKEMLDKRAAGGKGPTTKEMPTMFAMVDFLSANVSDKETDALRKLIDLLSRKKDLASKVAKDIQYQSLMEIWLYVHVPMSFALIAALLGHIVSVFFYW